MKIDIQNRTRIIISGQRRLVTLVLATAIMVSTLLAFSLFFLNLPIQEVLAYDDNGTQTSDGNELSLSNSTTNSSSSSSSPTSPAATSTPLNNQSESDRSPQARDKFGIEMLYPSRPDGEEWYINMANPLSDLRFNPQDPITKNKDGSWKIKSDQVRMYVSTSNGYNPNQITSESGQNKVAERGFMGSPRDWRDVEITGYVKLNKFSENDNFVWYTRGGKHTDSDPCQGSSYKGNLFYHGETQFAKEQWHVSYAKSPTIPATSPLEGKWVGFKFVMYSFITNDGKSGVKLENWLDSNADGRNWEKVYEGADGGKWGRSGTDCKVKADQIISWGGPLATFRWDFAPDVDFRDLSVREINTRNLNTTTLAQNINYFTGTSKSSNVPDFANYVPPPSDISNPDQNLILNQAIRKQSGTGNSNTSDPRQGSLPPVGSGGGGEIIYSKQISSGMMVYSIWVQGDEDNTDLYLKVSQDGGVTFGDSINISQNPASLSYNPQIVASGQNVYIVWEDDDGNSGTSDIFFVSSSDGGRSFSGKMNLSDDPSGSGNPQLSVEGNNVYVAWIGTSPDSTDVFLTQSASNGNSFASPINVSDDPEISYNPVLSVNGTHVILEWTDQNEMGATQTKYNALPNLPIETENNDINDLSSELLNSSSLSPPITSQDNSTSANDLKNTTDNEAEEIVDPTADPNVGNQSVISIVDNSEHNLSPNSNSSLVNSGHDATLINKPADTVRSPNSNTILTLIDDNKTTFGMGGVEEQGSETVDQLSTDVYGIYNGQDQDTSETSAEKPTHDPASLSAIMTAAEEEMKKNIEKINEAENTETTVSSQNLESNQPSIPILQSHQTNTPTTTTKQQRPTAHQDGDVKGELSGRLPGNDISQGQGNMREQQQQQQRQQQHQQESEPQQDTSKLMRDQQNKPDQAKPPETVNQLESSFNSMTSTERPLPSPGDLQKLQEQQALKLQLRKEMERQQNIEFQEQKNKNELKKQLIMDELKARNEVQALIQKAQQSFAISNELINEAKLADQTAQKAIVEYSSQVQQHQGPQDQQQEPDDRTFPPEIVHLIDLARAADERASQAVETYNNLQNAAESAVQEFNEKYG